MVRQKEPRQERGATDEKENRRAKRPCVEFNQSQTEQRAVQLEVNLKKHGGMP